MDKNLIALLICFILFAGCIDKKERTDEIETPEEKLGISEQIATENPVSSSIKDLKFEVTVPDNIKYDGKWETNASWEDSNGKNLLLICLTDVFDTPGAENEDEKSRELYAYHYILGEGGKSKLLWKVTDFVRECPLDIRMDYIPRSLSVTDLDSNGIAETTFMYVLSCKGDVSPDDVKLIMHEGKNKYAIRGTNIVSPPEFRTEYEGQTNIDPSFNKAPKEFLEYAKKVWDRFRDL